MLLRFLIVYKYKMLVGLEIHATVFKRKTTAKASSSHSVYAMSVLFSVRPAKWKRTGLPSSSFQESITLRAPEDVSVSTIICSHIFGRDISVTEVIVIFIFCKEVFIFLGHSIKTTTEVTAWRRADVFASRLKNLLYFFTDQKGCSNYYYILYSDSS